MTQRVVLERLPPDLEQFVQQELASGHYQSAEEVICEGLRCLKAHTTQKPHTGLSQEHPSTASSQGADEVIHEIIQALATGEFALARRLATEGASQYPKHGELQRYARVLAPPTITRTDRSPDPSIRANRDWLTLHEAQYKGSWVALREGELVDIAPSLQELVAQLGETQDLFVTKIT